MLTEGKMGCLWRDAFSSQEFHNLLKGSVKKEEDLVALELLPVLFVAWF